MKLSTKDFNIYSSLARCLGNTESGRSDVSTSNWVFPGQFDGGVAMS